MEGINSVVSADTREIKSRIERQNRLSEFASATDDDLALGR